MRRAVTDERDDTPATVTQNPWQALRRLTPAASPWAARV